MQRRTYLTSIAAALAATAGCTGGSAGDAGSTESESPTGSPTPTPSQPRITEYSLEGRENCDEPGAAEIAVDGQVVVVEGCIVGKDGCQVPVLDSVGYEADELEVRVTTEKRSDADACTQQLVDLPYRVTVAFENGLPGTTRIIHDGVDGERQAGEAETN